MTSFKINSRTGDIAQWHEHVPDKYKILSSIPGTNKNKQIKLIVTNKRGNSIDSKINSRNNNGIDLCLESVSKKRERERMFGPQPVALLRRSRTFRRGSAGGS